AHRPADVGGGEPVAAIGCELHVDGSRGGPLVHLLKVAGAGDPPPEQVVGRLRLADLVDEIQQAAPVVRPRDSLRVAGTDVRDLMTVGGVQDGPHAYGPDVADDRPDDGPRGVVAVLLAGV